VRPIDPEKVLDDVGRRAADLRRANGWTQQDLADTLKVTLRHIQVCSRRGVTVADLCSRRRTRAVAQARHEVWWTLRNDPSLYLSLTEIGAVFGRDHATVHHGIHAHRARLAGYSTRDDSSP
jgi:chromosomal replication initiation ATPase DnaA